MPPDPHRGPLEGSSSRSAGSSAALGKVLAVASSGGHWVQLKRLLPAFEGYRLFFATVSASHESEVDGERFYVVNDSNRWNKLALSWTAVRMAWVLLRARPDIVVSTGAAPGFFAISLGKLLGARTIWVDSVANAERLSLSGEKAGRFADLWLTQWPHLERPGGPRYGGSLL